MKISYDSDMSDILVFPDNEREHLLLSEIDSSDSIEIYYDTKNDYLVMISETGKRLEISPTNDQFRDTLIEIGNTDDLSMCYYNGDNKGYRLIVGL